jgi:superfamily II RNA helicase
MLDTFQIEAIEAVERGESVIVSAPTGTGKTLVADYLADKILAQGKRLIYTAPIKALSNQKYKDFVRQFGIEKVGIMTGDVVMNPEAELLLMTTEVFRNQVLAFDPKLAEVAYVIFDEIHWLNDQERGTVWEESIILCPKHIQILGLSATIANASDLTRWLEDVRGEKVALVEEFRRIVPLTYSYYCKETGFVDYHKLMDYYKKNMPGDFEHTTHIDLITQIKKQYLPCLYFVFSRKQCGEKAHELASVQRFLTAEESAVVMENFLNYCGPEDEWSGSTRRLFRTCVRGIGYHHAGLIPLQKTLVEELFFQRLIRVMYCTETFSVGINYPVRAVCFDALHKYDGHSFRSLANHEFFQMSGRAGSRGLDAEGFSFARVDLNYFAKEPPLKFDIKHLEPLHSQFRLSYNTVLNLSATLNAGQIATFFEKSFAVYANRMTYQGYAKRLATLQAKSEQLEAETCELGDTLGCPYLFEPKAMEYQRMQKSYRNIKAKNRKKTYARRLEVRLKKWKALLDVVPRVCTPAQMEICRVLVPQKTAVAEELATVEAALANLTGSHTFQEEFARKKAQLEELGYMKGEELLPRGELAKNIYVQELFITELMFSSLLDDMDNATVCGLIACVDYEQKRNDFFRKTDLLQAGPLKQIMLPVELVCGMEAIRFDHRVANLVHDWSEGLSFLEIQKLTNLDEGDIISLFRRTIDLLRQMREATSDDLLKERLRECIHSLDRDEAAIVEL